MQKSLVVKQPQQQRTDSRAFAFFVPTKSRHHTIAIALVLHLQHHALVRFVSARDRFRYYAIQPGAFKTSKPIRRRCKIRRHRRYVHWWSNRRKQRLQLLPAFIETLVAQIAPAV